MKMKYRTKSILFRWILSGILSIVLFLISIAVFSDADLKTKWIPNGNSQKTLKKEQQRDEAFFGGEIMDGNHIGPLLKNLTDSFEGMPNVLLPEKHLRHSKLDKLGKKKRHIDQIDPLSLHPPKKDRQAVKHLKPADFSDLKLSEMAQPGDCYIDNTHGKRCCLPTFILLGCCHCGSSALFVYLNQHPQISIPTKETNWFQNADLKENVLIKDFYAKRLAGGRGIPEGVITGELGTRYIADPVAPKIVAEMLPAVKLMVMLREPGEQCFSGTNYNNRRWFIDHVPPLQDIDTAECLHEFLPDYTKDKERRRYVNDCEHSEYYLDGMKRWLEYFPRDQLLVFQSEELKSDGLAVMRKIEDFLGIPHYEHYQMHDRFNPSTFQNGKADSMPDGLRLLFDVCYKESTAELQDLLGEGFNWSPRERNYWYSKPGGALKWSKMPDLRLYGST